MAGMGSTMNSMTALEEELEKGLEVLEADLAELENSVYHLVRSNVQLAQVRIADDLLVRIDKIQGYPPGTPIKGKI